MDVEARMEWVRYSDSHRRDFNRMGLQGREKMNELTPIDDFLKAHAAEIGKELSARTAKTARSPLPNGRIAMNFTGQ